MSIFGKKKNKDKAEKGKAKKDGKKPATSEPPAQTQYKHVPTHAAADAAPKAAVNGQQLSKQATNYAQGVANFQHPLMSSANHPFARSSSPSIPSARSTPLPHQKGLNADFDTLQRNNSAEVFTTDPDAPPLPTSNITQAQAQAQAQAQNAASHRDGISRNADGFFIQQQGNAAPSFDSQYLGNPKMQAAARDRGYINPQPSTDSGYGSVAHSLAPSDTPIWHDGARPQLLPSKSDFLPELTLSEELAREPAFSEASFAGSDTPETTPVMKQTNEAWFKSGHNQPLQPNPAPDNIPAKPTKPNRSSKQPRSTRTDLTQSSQPAAGDSNPDERDFVEPKSIWTGQAQPVVRTVQPEERDVQQVQKARIEQTRSAEGFRRTEERDTQYPYQQQYVVPPPSQQQQQNYQHNHAPELARTVQSEPLNAPQTHFSQPYRSATPPLQHLEEPRATFAEPMRVSTPPPERSMVRESQPPLSHDLSHSQSAHEPEQPRPFVRYSSPPPQENNANSLERMVSMSQRSTLAPVGRLDGCKVNKRGKILDEEGEIIAELAEGDIMDCVRQRCNAYGEVVDDYGRVVGRVHLVESKMESPVMRFAQPVQTPHSQPSYYSQEPQSQAHQDFFSPPPVSPSSRHQNRASAQPDVFTPAWQRQSHSIHTGFARELRDHLAAASPSSNQTGGPVNFTGNVAPVELDATETIYEQDEEEDEALPIFDHSEVFMPPPVVPVRSSRRSETPSPPAEKARRGERDRSRVRSKEPTSAPHAHSNVTAAPTPSQHDHTDRDETGAEPSESAQEVVEPQDTSPTPVKAPIPVHASVLAAEEAAAEAQNAQSAEPPAFPFTLRQYEPKNQSDRFSPFQTRSIDRSWAGPPVPRSEETHQEPALGTAKESQPQPSAPQHPQPQQPQPQQLQQPNQQPNQQQQQTNRRSPSTPLIRNSIDGSPVDSSKSYIKPSMSPVPENERPAAEKKSPNLFSYQGEIPAADGPVSNANLAPARAKSPPLPSFPRQAFTGGAPSASPFAPMNSAQFSSAGGLGPRGTGPRQFTTGVPGPRPILNGKNSFHQPLKRSPLSSQGTFHRSNATLEPDADALPETTPPQSEFGGGEGDSIAGPSYTRQPSVRTLAGMQALNAQTNSKPRTYFTHAGRVSVEAGQPPPSQADGSATPAEPATAPSPSSPPAVNSAPQKDTTTKKKSRFSMGFGKKSQPVAA
ncbi:hypothetical protein BAUCODRAFT_129273 [Baudoinia panamericana UAMH 10762]|uniref:Uncharacterized protein n=1 Tax=Baudoinia panamericana (strain UAMH 10762) TaxID=717646 RepID=M2NI46_BAUPA|nr:uncharacterized protein BAUCODRAFT_129273 [Baudoinia panamericana UAMH 10762]EMC99019.1 hypothetical protein BAUCODRAFT_129273 [Baudoinia panamericana UAMH 10762]